MLAITSYPALDVFIGLAFLYFLLSIVCSSINEGIATVFRLRAKTLEGGLRALLADDPALGKTYAEKLYEDPRITALTKKSRLWWDRKPSYIPSRAFALALLDTVAPAASGQATAAGAQATKGLIGARGSSSDYDLLAKVQAFAKDLPDGRIRTMLQDALSQATVTVDTVRTSLERQFDEAMQRVSGWYKRRTQLILFVLALALVGAINADSFTIGQRLWKDDVLRTAVVAQADATVKQGQAASCAASGTPAEKAGKCVDQVKQLQLPLGWSRANSPKDIPADFGKALGLLLTAFALLLGAPFWFDTLSKLAQLRGTGRASANPSTPEGATTTQTAPQ